MKLLNLKLTPQQCQMMATAFIIAVVIALCYIVVKKFSSKKKIEAAKTNLRNRRLRRGTRRYDEARKRRFQKRIY